MDVRKTKRGATKTHFTNVPLTFPALNDSSKNGINSNRQENGFSTGKQQQTRKSRPTLYKSANNSLHSSFAMPRAPQSSQVQIYDAHLSNPRKDNARPVNVSSSTSLDEFRKPDVSPSQLFPNRASREAFKSTTYIRNVALPAVPAVAVGTPRSLQFGVRQITMAKERYLPFALEDEEDNSKCFFQSSLGNRNYSKGRGRGKNMTREQYAKRLTEQEKSRWLQRGTEFLPHRIPLGYEMHGQSLSVVNRYQITAEQQRMLRDLKERDSLSLGTGINSRRKEHPAIQKFVEKHQPAPEPHASPPTPIVVLAPSPILPTIDPSPVQNVAIPAFHQSSGAGDGDDDNEAGDNLSEMADDDDVFSTGSGRSRSGRSQANRSPKRAGIRVTRGGTVQPILDDVSKLVRKESISDLSDVFMFVESYVSDEHRRTFKKRFNKIDRARRGRIKIEDLQREMFGDSIDAENVMEVFDLDGDGTIDLEEFIAVAALNDRLAAAVSDSCKRRHSSDPLEFNLTQLAYHIQKFRTLFKLADESGDGRVETSEILLLLAGAFGLIAFDEDLGEAIVAAIDVNRTGFIEFVDFIQYIPFFLKLQRRIVKNPLSLDMIESAQRSLQRRRSEKSIVSVVKRDASMPLDAWSKDGEITDQDK